MTQSLTLNQQCRLPALLPEGATVQALIFFFACASAILVFDVYTSATLVYTAYTLWLASLSLRFGFNMAFADRFVLDYTPTTFTRSTPAVDARNAETSSIFPISFSSTGVFFGFYMADCQLAVMLEIRYTIHSNISSFVQNRNKVIELRFSAYTLNISYQNCFG